MGAVMHTEVTQPSWGHMDPSLGVAYVSQGHTGHQFAMGSSQSGMKDWGGIHKGVAPGTPPVLMSPTGRALWDGTELLDSAPPSSPLGTKGL